MQMSFQVLHSCIIDSMLQCCLFIAFHFINFRMSAMLFHSQVSRTFFFIVHFIFYPLTIWILDNRVWCTDMIMLLSVNSLVILSIRVPKKCFIFLTYLCVNATDSELNDHFQEKSIIFGLSQSAYGASLFLGYWGYLLLSQKLKVSYLFPFRYSYLFPYSFNYMENFLL